jgi:hypothetical protein
MEKYGRTTLYVAAGEESHPEVGGNGSGNGCTSWLAARVSGLLAHETLVGVTPLRSPENGSPDFSYFIHAQVTWSYHPPTSWNA